MEGMRLASAWRTEEAWTHGIVFEGFTAGQHQYNERAGEVFVQPDRCHNRNARQKVRAELAPPKFHEQFVYERNPTQRQRGKQRQIEVSLRRVKAKAEHKVRNNRGNRKHRDHRCACGFPKKTPIP